MKEEWRPVKDYENLYMVSNMGRVKSLERTVRNGKGCYRTVPERILKAGKNNNGYLQVQLHQDGKRKVYLVHRLVATVFCENQMGYNEVNHLDEDKENNCADNLEWCNRSYNLTYNGRAKKVGKKSAEKLTNNPKISKPIIGIDKVTGLIVEFPSAHEAERETGINQGSITKCCKGKYKSAGNFYWYYADTEE